MNLDNSEDGIATPQNSFKKIFCTPTTFSKILAAVILISLPFCGFFFGLQFSQQQLEKTVPIITSSLPSEVTVNELNNSKEFDKEIQYPQQLSFMAMDGTSNKFGRVVREFSFLYQNQKGSIKEVCDFGGIIQALGTDDACLGNSSLVLSWQNSENEIFTQIASTLEDVWSLAGIAFTEGKFSVSTSSTKVDTTLILYIDPENCISADGMCFSLPQGTLAIRFPFTRLPSITSTQIEAFPSQLFWNGDGTKAARYLTCPEGCPENVFIGISLDNSETSVLLTEAETKNRFKYKSDDFSQINWIDNKTIKIEDKVISF